MTLDRGKLAVLTMFGVAFLAAGLAWWWNYQRGQKCLVFYGSEAAYLVRAAPQVELLVLALADSEEKDGDVLEAAGQRWQVTRKVDLSEAKGLIHARTSIVDDTSFEWTRDPGDCQPDIRYGVRFGQPPSAITVAFDFGCRQVWLVERQRQATLIPKVAEGWESFLKRQAAQSVNSK